MCFTSLFMTAVGLKAETHMGRNLMARRKGSTMSGPATRANVVGRRKRHAGPDHPWDISG